MTITENIISAHLDCRYKSYLKQTVQNGEKHLLQEKYDTDILEYTEQFKELLVNNKKSILVLDNNCDPLEIVKSKANDYFFNVFLKKADYEVTATIKKCIANNEVLFSPVLIIGEQEIKDKHKILLAYYSYVIQLLFPTIANYGEIVYSKPITIKKIFLKGFIPKIGFLIIEVKKVFENNDQYFLLNKHCKICEYNKICKQKAIELDHLSLITTIKEKDICQLNSKGIFTVNQLSYTFKPRRKSKRQKNRILRHFIALKALAIRKETVYIWDSDIELENVSTKIYLDVEGYGEGIKFYYLIGIIIEKEANLIRKTYWISFKEESKEIYKILLNELESFCGDDFILFHYGTYDIEFLNYLTNYAATMEEKAFLQRLISNSVDALPFFLYKIYFPTFSNDLKSISNHIGFNWTSKNASGLDAIFWRKCWEDDQNSEWKNNLITYNLEDCLALKLVVDFIYSISYDNHNRTSQNVKISVDFTEEIRQRYGGVNFGNKDYILSNYNFINKRAYFDYQRDKVFVRTSKPRILKTGRTGKQFTNKPNQVITLKHPESCIFCGSNKTKITKTQTERTIVDLKKSKNGLRKWVIKYIAHLIRCKNCNKGFNPSEYKKIGNRYGFNLVIWVIYQYVANNTSFEKIGKTLEDFFHISIGKIGSRNVYEFKEIAAEYYKDTYQKLISSIDQWHILHADETRFRLRTSNGYIWVLTNLETVVFKFRSDRTCGFLDKITENFKGVFISDFYKGYESLKCKQQKCLVHLLRDVNDILFKEQQNEEVKLIANNFSSLLKKIVLTIDVYGLKKRNLHKHLKDVESFYKKISLADYQSREGKALFERFLKSKKKLFTFLSCDNVPWNNNNAEHSFKHFAIYRRQANGLFTEKSIEEYLILLSIYQTCKYRGINFLEFLLSKEIDIDVFINKHTRGRKKIKENSLV